MHDPHCQQDPVNMETLRDREPRRGYGMAVIRTYVEAGNTQVRILTRPLKGDMNTRIGSIYMILHKEKIPVQQRERIIEAIMDLERKANDDNMNLAKDKR